MKEVFVIMLLAFGLVALFSAPEMAGKYAQCRQDAGTTDVCIAQAFSTLGGGK